MNITQEEVNKYLGSNIKVEQANKACKALFNELKNDAKSSKVVTGTSQEFVNDLLTDN